MDEGGEYLVSTLVEAKRSFYRQPEVAAVYDRQRFGGPSGNYVNERETSLVAALLPAKIGVMADVGCGTGRLLAVVRSRVGALLGLDASLPMLRETRHKLLDPTTQPSGNPGASHARAQSPHPASPMPPGEGHSETPDRLALVQADAFSLPLAPGACDAVTSLRVLFHFDDVRPLLKEMRRATRPGGRLVCDTSAWSPRSLLPLGRGRWGERVATISRQRFRAIAQAAGWKVVEERPCFLISPYMYRRLPLPLVRRLERLERHLPEPLLCRVFWGLEAA